MRIIGIPWFRGGVVVGGPVSVWTGSVFGSQSQIWSAGSGRCVAGVPVAVLRVFMGLLVFCGFAGVSWLAGASQSGLSRTGLGFEYRFLIRSVVQPAWATELRVCDSDDAVGSLEIRGFPM